MKATEMKVVESNKIEDSEEGTKAAPSTSSSSAASTTPAPSTRTLLQSEGKDKSEKEEEEEEEVEENYKIEIEVEDESKPFVPSIKIIRSSDVSLLISTMVLKDISLSSTLFQILEQEDLQVEFETQYRGETKVSHTIKVNMKPGYDVDELEKKLWRWAGKPT